MLLYYNEDLEFSSYKKQKEQNDEFKGSEDGNTSLDKIHFFKNNEQIKCHTRLLSRHDSLKMKIWFKSIKAKPTLAITIRKNLEK